MSQMIVKELKEKGVNFFEKTILTSLSYGQNKKIMAEFSSVETSEDGLPLNKFSKLFDTVVFAIGTVISLDYLELGNAGIEIDILQNKILTNQYDQTSVSCQILIICGC